MNPSVAIPGAEAITDVIEVWRRRPDQFVRDAYPGYTPDAWQDEALIGLAEEDKVSIRACHGPGKSAVDAWAIMWFMTCFFPTRVPCTAPTSHQLNDILWSELDLWLSRMVPELRVLFRHTSTRFEWVSAPKQSYAVARTARADQPEALQGFHCDNILFILDEASGIVEPVFEVAEGTLSSEGAKILMTANPTRTSGYFYDSHHKMRHRWKTMRISHEDSPRVTDRYVEDMALKYGRDSNVFRVRCQGDFPKSDDDTLIPLDTMESAKHRDVEPWGDTVWGVDVARFGDDRSALCKACANAIIVPPEAWNGLKTTQLSGKIINEYNATNLADRPTAIYVDLIGIGAGVVDQLDDAGLPVIGVNVSESPADDERFMRLRDELYWNAREAFERLDFTMPGEEEIGKTGFSCEDIIAELSPIKYSMTATGKILVESKDDLKKRKAFGSVVNSPDIGESFVLTRMHTFSRVRRKMKTSYSREERRRKHESITMDDDDVV